MRSVLRRALRAPDPGRLRLRTGLRAVLGVTLAVAAVLASGLGLFSALAGGLAALLALFTVTDFTVRAQLRTTALLPLAGLPVLAAATALHPWPLARDAVFLLIVFAGVYARRWGPRGNALGIFAFMMFFVVQFLGAGPDRLPGLWAAVVVSLGCAAAVRYGLWRIERRALPPRAPAPPEAGGLRRLTTRQAFQAAAACGLALAAGQLVSTERWYWAVGAAWWIFVNTASRGETLVRGFRRILGTVAGIAAGTLVALPIGGAPLPTALLAAVCVFGIFYTAPLSYSWMMFFVTLLVSLLYGLLGVLHPGLLGLRLQETAVGALGAALAVSLILPVTTHAATQAWIHRALECVRGCTELAARRIAGDTAADPAERVAELEAVLGRARLALAPLLHPLNPRRARRERARRVLGLLDACALRVRALAEIAADPSASHDARLTDACRRVEAAVGALLEPAVRPRDVILRPLPAAVPPALEQLHELERALLRLAPPLHSAPDAPSPVSEYRPPLPMVQTKC